MEYLPALDINYWDENGDGLIERPNTDYSNEMRAVWESFLASMQYDPVQQGQAYLFVIPGITEGGDVRGYMPIKSRYGFVTADATTRDVAHELGHGVFNLRHTFSEENSFTLPQGETDNLMDYSTGTELWKYQWDFIHNPEGGWHIFEEVEEGEIVYPQNNLDEVFSVIEEIKHSNINGGALNYYLQFNKEIYAFAENVELGDKTYDYIMIDAPLTNYDEGKKEIASDRYDLGNVTTKNIPYTDENVEVIPIKFEKYVPMYDTYEDAYFHVYVTAEDIDTLKNYLFGIDIQEMQVNADSAVSLVEGMVGNGMGCNLGLRSYLYLHKGDSVLFPTKKSMYSDIGGALYYDSVASDGRWWATADKIFSGEVKNDGQANDMYDGLENEEISSFEQIPNTDGCDYPDFDNLQEQANEGTIIVGVKNNSGGSGHVVVLMPESLNERSDINRAHELPSNNIITLPISLECGQGQKEIRPFEDKTSILAFKWYKYEK
ncbi:hypothetical protein L21SP5_00224 [Salinivirga cyanobacteriivorans]|uniref:Uncharacterized protein n=1 Tax=Salinivirga cyanobacteriivorans TaxID=1307839 RepID=A0A0S2HV34_9BACT|nr:hypothetical protein [Salinivirga cyanobacteriivorans]ALO13904.1 hypothetical protein L21SP5_00224 [Salinivirga cyanobacteriivorans]